MHDKVGWYVGAWFDGVIGCLAAIPSYKVSHVCTFAMAENVVDGVFTVDFRTFYGAFRVVASGV